MRNKRNKSKIIVGISVIFIGLVLLVIFSKCGSSGTSEEPVAEDTVQVQQKAVKYGLPIEDFKVTNDTVQPGESLSVLLGRQGLSSGDIFKLDARCEGIFDTRKIRSGKPYALLFSRDSVPELKYFIYESDPVDYFVFDLSGDYKVTKGQNPVSWEKKVAKGVVNTSLWAAMTDSGTSPQLAVVLSHIFGWTIDFFGIQQGDEFRLIYEQQHVSGEPISNFNIIAASFMASDSLYYAIPFVQDDEELYYNEKGNSLEGAFLKAPLDFYRITSRFTNSRFHPVLKRYRAHHGVDYAAPTGTPVYAIGSGKVIAKGYQARGGGNYIKIRHNGTYTTSYMHLSRFAKGVGVGSSVKQKQVIGYVGSTGLSTGPHLDFRVFENGRPINPLTVKSQPKKPISKANMPQFKIVCDSLVNELKSL